ncbi:sulfite exporter TauE/SafE family protein [Pseudomonas saliphila]|uniref:sulfite exporter TauE/SafE family protein n=1 Tax=Pseudomonas saliphila TaxID=2586906 RepID=UPI001F1A6127|nr:sulfite exporter TauE/SafE family protein [Pseudomonas saliphila]
MTPELLPLILTALALGLLGGGHCIGMCGGLMGALTLAIPVEQRRGWPMWRILLGYNAGRIASYTAAGALLGSVGWLVRDLGLDMLLRTIAGLLMIAMGLYLANWWSGLTRIEGLGRGLWKHIEPHARRLLPVKRAPQAIALGALWGWLPCGLVYSTLVWASSQGSTGLSAGLMLAFGIGTLPTLLATGLAAERLMALLRKRAVRVSAAIMVILFGIWTLPGPHKALLMGHGPGHSSAQQTQPHH